MIEVCHCALCRQEYPASVLMSFAGQKICLSCMVWHTRTCSCCGSYIWKKDALVKGDLVFCPECAQNQEWEG